MLIVSFSFFLFLISWVSKKSHLLRKRERDHRLKAATHSVTCSRCSEGAQFSIVFPGRTSSTRRIIRAIVLKYLFGCNSPRVIKRSLFPQCSVEEKNSLRDLDEINFVGCSKQRKLRGPIKLPGEKKVTFARALHYWRDCFRELANPNSKGMKSRVRDRPTI